MNNYKKIEELLQRMMAIKERIDCEHVRKTARFGCACRRCKTARKCLTGRKLTA